MIWTDDISAPLPPMPSRWLRYAMLTVLSLAMGLIVFAGTSWGGAQ